MTESAPRSKAQPPSPGASVVTSDRTFEGVDTGLLRTIAKFLEAHPQLKEHIGSFARFTVVVDANAVIADLVYRVRYPERGPTALMELLNSTVLEAWAPVWLDAEVRRALPRVAKKKRLETEALLKEWSSYSTLFRWMHIADDLRLADEQTVVDPKDLPYIALAAELEAVGIITNDSDIAAMGGKPLSFSFVRTSRDYARAVVVPLSLRLFGVVVPFAVLLAVGGMLRALVLRFRALPPHIQALLVGFLVIAILHPRSRQWLAGQVATAMHYLGSGVRSIDALIQAARQELAAKGAEAEALLREISRLAGESAHVPTRYPTYSEDHLVSLLPDTLGHSP